MRLRVHQAAEPLDGGAALVLFFFQAEDGIRDKLVTGVQTCALPISARRMGLPCIVRQQGYEWRSWDVKRLAPGIRAFLVNSEDVARDVEALGVPRSRIEIGRAACRERG